VLRTDARANAALALLVLDCGCNGSEAPVLAEQPENSDAPNSARTSSVRFMEMAALR
jgi:hypothetical protein